MASSSVDSFTGSASEGRKIFRTACMACHAMESNAAPKQGPNLKGLLGRKSGAATGYSYSAAVKNKGVIWEDKTIDEYLSDPKKYIPGNRMAFSGLKNPKDRADLIRYLK